MQRDRRTNPYPFTWEIPAAAAVGVLAAVLLGLQVGRSVANTFPGNGWVFVPREALFSSLPGLVRGDAGAGMPGVVPASPALMWTGVTAVELVVVIGCAVAGKECWNRWGPGRLQGMATRDEAERLLGLRRLRRAAKVVRPDVYGGGRR